MLSILNLKRTVTFPAMLCALFLAPGGIAAPTQGAAQGASQLELLTEGSGIQGIRIGTSTKSDVEAKFGNKYRLTNHGEYSREMEYDNLRLSFYYCQGDKKKTIFLIEAYRGVTPKGIVIGQSTLKDVLDAYGSQSETTGGDDGEPDIYVYSGIQFYFKRTVEVPADVEDNPAQLVVIEIDLTAPDKTSNFCDEGEDEPQVGTVHGSDPR